MLHLIRINLFLNLHHLIMLLYRSYIQPFQPYQQNICCWLLYFIVFNLFNIVDKLTLNKMWLKLHWGRRIGWCAVILLLCWVWREPRRWPSHALAHRRAWMFGSFWPDVWNRYFYTRSSAFRLFLTSSC